MQKNITYKMISKFKKFENQISKSYIVSVISLDENNTDNYVFIDKKDMENYILNYVNNDILDVYQNDIQDLIEVEPTHFENCLLDENQIPCFTNWESAFEWFNDNYINNEEISMRIDYNAVDFISNVKIDKRTEKLINLQKYNL